MRLDAAARTAAARATRARSRACRRPPGGARAARRSRACGSRASRPSPPRPRWRCAARRRRAARSRRTSRPARAGRASPCRRAACLIRTAKRPVCTRCSVSAGSPWWKTHLRRNGREGRPLGSSGDPGVTRAARVGRGSSCDPHSSMRVWRSAGRAQAGAGSSGDTLHRARSPCASCSSVTRVSSARQFGPPVVWGTIRSSQRGIHQLRSPSSCITAGTSTSRTIVASTSTAVASPSPISFRKTSGRQRQRAEDDDHDRRGGGDHARGAGQALGHRARRVAAAQPRLADAREQEHLVVHREAEQRREHDHGDERRDRRRRCRSRRAGRPSRPAASSATTP